MHTLESVENVKSCSYFAKLLNYSINCSTYVSSLDTFAKWSIHNNIGHEIIYNLVFNQYQSQLLPISISIHRNL